jgi:hypothetical protein
VLSTLRFFRKEYTELLQEETYGGPIRNGNGHANGNGNGTKEEFSPMI